MDYPLSYDPLEENLSQSSSLSQEDSFHTAPEEEAKQDTDKSLDFGLLQNYIVQFISDLSQNHDLIADADSEIAPTLTKRLNKEIKVLTRGLPCTSSYSIFIGVDSANMKLMKALIAGSEGTPYAHGLFEFHIAIPNTYPNFPPVMSLHTGLVNTVAFNPNLYNNGYVCLSIINTWSGDPEEMWSPDKNLLQVLLSIQVLVMDNNIIQKEPACSDMPEDSIDNIIYQNIIKYATIQHTMIDVLRNPPKGFENVVENYFRIKRNEILKTINNWLDNARGQSFEYTMDDQAAGYNESLYLEIKNQGYANALQNVAIELQNEFIARYGSVEVYINEIETQPLLYETNMPTILLREPSSSDPQAPESVHPYFQHLGDHRFNATDWDAQNATTYCYDASTLNQQGIGRINKEIKALTRSLPCEPSGAVFIGMDSSNMSRIKALISGTEDTPYEHGLYLFDIKLPQDYPNSPPLMTIKTTGNGLHRFNPNLYDTGYVCLSVINTWDGDPEEMWNPSYSTLLQVFLSIQALVMNQAVIQKEPSYEGYSIDSKENMEYIMIVRYGNIKYAMSSMIQNPPIEFTDVVVKHFAIKKKEILKTIEKWLEEAKNFAFEGYEYLISSHNAHTVGVFAEKGIYVAFQEAVDELKGLLDTLPEL